MDLKRGRAADVIDMVRSRLADRKPPEEIEAELEGEFGIEPLRKCSGEAHSNPFIDNCPQCAPRWGVVGARVNVR